MAEYLALPKGDGRHPAVVVIQEWWGVNDQIKGICDKWAREGFVAVAPDLYHGKVVPIGESDEAQAMMSNLDQTRAMQDVIGAIETARAHPRSNGKVVVTGYCLGGAFALAAAAAVRGLAAIVPFYGIPPAADWSKVDAPIQMHVAQHDDWVSVAAANQVQAAVPGAMELHVYDAHHAFCNERRPEVYNESAATQAWQRALAFARKHTA
jgi:carboxymethylenebutenolidase